MERDIEISRKANELRKSGDLENAIQNYRILWDKEKDKFTGAGLANCYRKLKNFEEALKISEEAYKLYPDFDWCKNEYIWSLIQGELFNLPIDSELYKTIDTVNKIIELNPDEIAFRITIFRLLKASKKQKQWDILNLWITKIEPASLTGYSDESSGWTDKELWYYYRVNGLLNSSGEDEALKIIEENKKEFYKQSFYFNRLKARAFINKGIFKDAILIYDSLLLKKNDWWLLMEYAELLKLLGKEKESLGFFIKAASAPPMKLEMKVSLFEDIGDLFVKLDNINYALPHFKLSKVIREKNDWGTKKLEEKINLIEKNNIENLSLKAILKECETIWKEYLSENKSNGKAAKLEGEVSNLNEERQYCFLITKDKKSYFCGSKNLPLNAKNGIKVKFDIIESFNKKKKEKSFQAINVELL